MVLFLSDTLSSFPYNYKTFSDGNTLVFDKNLLFTPEKVSKGPSKEKSKKLKSLQQTLFYVFVYYSPLIIFFVFGIVFLPIPDNW